LGPIEQNHDIFIVVLETVLANYSGCKLLAPEIISAFNEFQSIFFSERSSSEGITTAMPVLAPHRSRRVRGT
jgi:hypothetical protein